MISHCWEDDILCIPAMIRSVILAVISAGSVITMELAHLSGVSLTTLMISQMVLAIVICLNAESMRKSL